MIKGLMELISLSIGLFVIFIISYYIITGMFDMVTNILGGL